MKSLHALSALTLCLVTLTTLSDSFAENSPDVNKKAHPDSRTLQIVAIEFCPVICFRDNQQTDLTEIVTAIYAEHDIDVEYLMLPMGRAFKEVLEGRYDGIINPDHPALLSLSRTHSSLYDMQVCSYSSVDSAWNKDTDPHMASLQLGLVKDYNYSSYSKTLNAIVSLAVQEGRVEYIVPFSQQDARNFRKLLAGRIDATITSYAVAKYLIEQNQWQKRIKASHCFEEILPTYIWFSPKHATIDHYRSIFDNNIERYKQHEPYKTMIKAYQYESLK